jgi:hypothetical protein
VRAGLQRMGHADRDTKKVWERQPLGKVETVNER